MVVYNKVVCNYWPILCLDQSFNHCLQLEVEICLKPLSKSLLNEPKNSPPLYLYVYDINVV